MILKTVAAGPIHGYGIAKRIKQTSAGVNLLRVFGPTLRFPHSSGVSGSRHSRMRELRIQHEGRPFRVLYAFDPARTAILLIGGENTGHDRWREQFVPRSDRPCGEHLETLQREGKIEWPGTSGNWKPGCRPRAASEATTRPSG